MNFQWYTGHMTKAKRQMQEDIKLIDLVIELVDARIPLSSRNPDIDELGKNKYRLILMNKADLADKERTREWSAFFKYVFLAVLVNCAVFFSIESFSFFDWADLLINIGGSTLLTTLFVIAMELIRIK